MLSKKGKGKYILHMEDEKYPIELNQTLTDTALYKIKDACSKVTELLDTLEDNEYDLYRLLYDRVFSELQYYHDEEPAWYFKRITDNVEELQTFLNEHNDDIKPIEEIEDLEDHGYKLEDFWRNPNRWVKTLYDEPEKEIVEEVLIVPEGPVRRKRTILYDVKPGLRSSKEIKYEKLEIDKDLMRLINNTKNAYNL